MTPLKLYPSGLRGSAIVPQSAPIHVTQVLKASLQGLPVDRGHSFTASTDVAALYDKAGQSLLVHGAATFVFQEQTLLLALRLFARPTFAAWIAEQHASSETNSMHWDYIEALLSSIMGLKPWLMTSQHWARLVVAEGDHVDTPPEGMNTRAFIRDQADMSLISFLEIWVRQMGWRHLLDTLLVMFGPRAGGG